MKVERPRPRALARGLCWDYQTRHGLPGYYIAPTLTIGLLGFNTALYTGTGPHPATLLITLLTMLAYGAGLARWWTTTGYRTTRTLVKVCCRHCPYVAFTAAQDIAERGMRTHLAETHGIEAADDEIGRYVVDHIDEHHRGDTT